MNLDFILEAQRFFVVEPNVHARPADLRAGLVGDDRVADRSEKPVLGRLHVFAVVGEMHDAGHVGLGKLDGADEFELVCHGGNVERLGAEDDRFLLAEEAAQIGEHEVGQFVAVAALHRAGHRHAEAGERFAQSKI